MLSNVWRPKYIIQPLGYSTTAHANGISGIMGLD